MDTSGSDNSDREDASGPGFLRPPRHGMGTAGFYLGLPELSGFNKIADPASFVPLPQGWVIGLADVRSSTEAIAAGRYKRVNTAGAAVISAVSNALGHLDFPFLFGGDGASFAVGPEDASRAATALAAAVSWVGRELDLPMRGGVVSIEEVRQSGAEVRVARFAASAHVDYAMFAGGGMTWAEQRLKAGALTLPAIAPTLQPDLTGLSCRFQDHAARHGVILSVLVRPTGSAEDPRFQVLLSDILAAAERSPGSARPTLRFEPLTSLRMQPHRMQARLLRRPGESLGRSRARAITGALAAAALLGLRIKAGGFSARRYLREVVENSDFRKYGDGLMMTLDCGIDTADAIEHSLLDAEQQGIVHFGLHRQGTATVTCVIPSPLRSNHLHFIDGAEGGYAMAAVAMKTRLASPRGV